MLNRAYFSLIKKHWPILSVGYFAFIGISLPLAIMAPIFLQESSPFFANGVAMETRNTYLGLALAAFPLGEFIGSPIMGFLADRFGRRKILLMGQWPTGIAYLLTAWSLSAGHLGLFLLLRFFTGLCEGTGTLAQATLSQLEEGTQKLKVLGLLTTFISLGYVTGPLLGAIFEKATTPFILIGLLHLLVSYFLHLSLNKNQKEIGSEEYSLSWRTLLEKRPFWKMLFISLLATSALTLYVEFTGAYLLQNFSFSRTDLSLFWMAFSLLWALAGPLIAIGEKRWSVKQRLMVAMGITAAALAGIPFIHHTLHFIFLSVFIILGIAMSSTFFSFLILETLPSKFHGVGGGIRNSLRVFSDASFCLAGGSLLNMSNLAPFLLAMLFLILSMLFLAPRRN